MYQRVALTIVLFFVSVGLASAFQVPDTGITECYDAVGNSIFPCPGPGEPYYGQDGNVIYNSMNFTDNGDTATDNVTGLVWKKTDDGIARTWDEAVIHCDGLNSINFGGHDSGWRLPALVELDSLLDLSVNTDTGAAAINAIFAATAAAAYWTSTEDPDDGEKAWILDFGATENDTAVKSGTNYTLCVWEVVP